MWLANRASLSWEGEEKGLVIHLRQGSGKITPSNVAGAKERFLFLGEQDEDWIRSMKDGGALQTVHPKLSEVRRCLSLPDGL